MEDAKYTLARRMGISLSAEDADKLLGCADGSAALLYLYMLRNGGEFSPPKAARDLKHTEREIKEAAERLRDLGLLNRAGETHPVPQDELPEYAAEDIARRSASDQEFKAVVTETQRIMGRMLSVPELKILFGIYDYLGLPAEVILTLINHCVEEHQEKHGPGRIPTMRRIEKEAYIWANREILTLESAEAYLRELREKKHILSQVKEVLQIRGRDLSSTEKKYVESWLEMGFGLEALAVAYDKTVVKTGKLAWSYMNSILESWHGKGLHTVEEIEKGDMLPQRKTSNGGSSSVPQRSDFERMKKMLEKMRNG
ncbi:MAG: DnaD domain protein [Oscillospiraceae bacterium]|jgi:DnaD/phage-associated family protein